LPDDFIQDTKDELDTSLEGEAVNDANQDENEELDDDDDEDEDKPISLKLFFKSVLKVFPIVLINSQNSHREKFLNRCQKSCLDC
jgi:hypothetical protein